MAFQKMKWIDVPDPNNMPTIDDIVDRPEYQNTIPAFDAENMNRIEDGVADANELLEVLPIEHGGTGATSKEKALVSLGFDKYQIPWNVDSNLAKINNNSATTSVRADNNIDFTEKSFELHMINSGQVYLKYDITGANSSGNAYDAKECEVTIYQNDNKLITHNHSEIFYNLSNMILLNVKKGDKIIFNSKCKTSNDNYSAGFEVTIDLYANAETAYKYINLDLKTDSITATDILNALTGGAD